MVDVIIHRKHCVLFKEDKTSISSICSTLVLVALSFIIFLSSTMGYFAYMKKEFSTIRLIDPWFLYILILTSAIPSFSLLGLVVDECVVYDDNKLLDTMWPSYYVNVRVQ